MNSWKCGNAVTIELCQYPLDTKEKQDEVDPKDGIEATRIQHCNSGILFNRAMGTNWSDTVDQLTIGVAKPPCCPVEPGDCCDRNHPNWPDCDNEPATVCLATVYSENDCGGESKLIRSDVVYRPNAWDPIKKYVGYDTKVKGSWATYNGPTWSHFSQGTAESVLFTGGCAIEVFNETNHFMSESYTMRMDPSKNYACKEALYIPSLNGWQWTSASGAADAAAARDTYNYFGYLAW